MKQELLKKEYRKLLAKANKYRNDNISLYIQTLMKAISIREKFDKNNSKLQFS